MTSVSLDQGAPRHLRLVKTGALDLDAVQAWIGEIVKKEGSASAGLSTPPTPLGPVPPLLACLPALLAC